MMRISRIKTAAIVLSVIAILVFIGDLIRTRLLQVGGLPGSYDARDHDPILSKEAVTARPLIDELARYRAEHGRFPTDTSGIEAGLFGWEYMPHPTGYLLSKKLGWDPSLQYSFDHDEGRWIFEPGDGSPEREIEL